MDKTQTDQHNQDSGNMLNQKTNEDYNKEKPNPNDPNLKKTNQTPNERYKVKDDQEAPDKKMAEKAENKSEKVQTIKVYTCSMHPEVKSDKPGKCPKCGMKLLEKK